MLTIKEFIEESRDKNDIVAMSFSFLLDTCCRFKKYVIEYLTEGAGTIINEHVGIAFPESKAFFKDEEGYIEEGMELYMVHDGWEKDGLTEVESFLMNSESAYRYLRLYYNDYLKRHPEDEEGLRELDEAYKFYREKYNISEEDPEFDYFNVIGNIYKYVKWYWDTNRWEE
jgi:hypothetical protein